MNRRAGLLIAAADRDGIYPPGLELPAFPQREGDERVGARSERDVDPSAAGQRRDVDALDQASGREQRPVAARAAGIRGTDGAVEDGEAFAQPGGEAVGGRGG